MLTPASTDRTPPVKNEPPCLNHGPGAQSYMETGDLSEYTQANRRAMNAAAPLHRECRHELLMTRFKEKGYSYLTKVQTEILGRIGVSGKAVAQLACNNGREILSIKNLGAGRCVGFDISEAFIAEGKELAAAGGIDCDLVVADVYAIPDAYLGQFDIVFISVGALILLPDVRRLLGVVAGLLVPGGTLFIYERHPILDLFHWGDTGDPPTISGSYFQSEPTVSTTGYNYWNKQPYDSPPIYRFHHTLSDIFDACLRNGFSITDFKEYGHDISAVFKHFEKNRHRLPLCYSLVARR